VPHYGGYNPVPALLNTAAQDGREKSGLDGLNEKPHNLPSLLLNKTLQQQRRIL
jgi:hypothetical protein